MRMRRPRANELLLETPARAQRAVVMTAIFKTFLGAPGPENQPSGEEIIAKLKTRWVYMNHLVCSAVIVSTEAFSLAQ